jgi:hypothetical protein
MKKWIVLFMLSFIMVCSVLLMPISTDRKLMELPDRELLDIMTIA